MFYLRLMTLTVFTLSWLAKFLLKLCSVFWNLPPQQTQKSDTANWVTVLCRLNMWIMLYHTWESHHEKENQKCAAWPLIIQWIIFLQFHNNKCVTEPFKVFTTCVKSKHTSSDEDWSNDRLWGQEEWEKTEGLEDDKKGFGELNSNCAEKVITGNHADGRAAVLQGGGVTNTPVADCLVSFSKSILDYSVKYSHWLFCQIYK